MAKTKTKTGHRIVMQLDPRIALEAILLNRLERIPTSRRQEWLRGLLVQGFRTECQALRGAQDDEGRRQTRTFSNWMTSNAQKPDPSPALEPVAAKARPMQANTANKPFAALGKVIGQGNAVT